MIRCFKIAHVPCQMAYPCWKVRHHNICITFSLTNATFMTRHKGSQMFHGFFVTEYHVILGAVRPQGKVIYVHEQNIQTIFAFLLLKGTFATWRMRRKHLLATSNESPIFENQIKKKYVKKKKYFLVICRQHIEICFTRISVIKNMDQSQKDPWSGPVYFSYQIKSVFIKNYIF
jgi:hypothetical protein